MLNEEGPFIEYSFYGADLATSYWLRSAIYVNKRYEVVSLEKCIFPVCVGGEELTDGHDNF